MGKRDTPYFYRGALQSTNAVYEAERQLMRAYGGAPSSKPINHESKQAELAFEISHHMRVTINNLATAAKMHQSQSIVGACTRIYM